MAGTGPTPDRTLPETERTRHRRLREQGSRDRDDLDAILQAGFLCHLGVVVDGAPTVVATVYGADGATLYFHGSVAGRSLAASPAATVCTSADPSPVATVRHDPMPVHGCRAVSGGSVSGRGPGPVRPSCPGGSAADGPPSGGCRAARRAGAGPGRRTSNRTACTGSRPAAPG